MPLVSVVMANYNGEQYLASALNSILAQSFIDFELIIVDDGSSDTSRDIISQYARSDRRIRNVYMEHCGFVKALNYGCALSRGDFIARLDSDDIAKCDRLEAQVAFMIANPAIALVGGAIECIDTDGKWLFSIRLPGRADGLHEYLLLDCHISHSTVLLRKSVFEDVGGYRAVYQNAVDYDLFLRISDNHLVDNLPKILCQYRLHPNQVSAYKGAQQIISGIGARLATRARRAKRPEPTWKGEVVSREDLIREGISAERIDSMIREYAECSSYSDGWRWKKAKSCELIFPSAPEST